MTPPHRLVLLALVVAVAAAVGASVALRSSGDATPPSAPLVPVETPENLYP